MTDGPIDITPPPAPKGNAYGWEQNPRFRHLFTTGRCECVHCQIARQHAGEE